MSELELLEEQYKQLECSSRVAIDQAKNQAIATVNRRLSHELDKLEMVLSNPTSDNLEIGFQILKTLRGKIADDWDIK